MQYFHIDTLFFQDLMDQGSKIWFSIGLAGIGAGCVLGVIRDKLAKWRGKDELVVFTAPQIVSHYKRRNALCDDLPTSGNLSNVMIEGFVNKTSVNNDQSSLPEKMSKSEFAPLQFLLHSVPFMIKDEAGGGNEIATVIIKENKLPSHLHSVLKCRDNIYQLTYDTQIALIGNVEKKGNGGDIIFYPQKVIDFAESKKGIKLSTIFCTVLIIAGISAIAVAIWRMKNKPQENEVNDAHQPIEERGDGEPEDNVQEDND